MPLDNPIPMSGALPLTTPVKGFTLDNPTLQLVFVSGKRTTLIACFLHHNSKEKQSQKNKHLY
jgi:hypothetical protein